MKSPYMKINLLPQEIRDQRKYELWYPWIASATAILLVLLAIIFVISAVVASSQEQTLATTRAEVATTESQAGQLKSYEDEKAMFDARAKVVESALADRMDPYLLAIAVSKCLPSDIWVQNMTFSSSTGFSMNAVVEDTGDNPATKDWGGVAGTLDAIESSVMLRNAWLTNGSMSESGSGYEKGDETTYPSMVEQFVITADALLALDSGKTPLWTSQGTGPQ